MDDDKASRFISSLVKSIQALCNGFVEFSNSIEVVGHIHLNIDRNLKLDYVLTEEVSKSVSEGSTVFSSHSYHSQPPPSLTSKSANDTSNSSQKSRKNNEADPLGLSALPREVPNTSRSEGHSHSSNRVSESSNSSHSFSRNSDSESLKHENNRSSCQIEDSSNKRRKMGPLSQNSPSPAAKRSRPNDFSSGSRTVIKEQGFEVIEIKEEPEEEPAVFFGNSATGQDIQTPDFSNVVMESLDRVNQIEGSDLVADGGGGDGMGGPQQPVFPVMFHQSDGMQSSSGGPVPGPSSDPQSAASTSGVEIGVVYSENEEISVQLAPREDGSSPPLPGCLDLGRRMKTIGGMAGMGWNRRGRYKNYSESDVMLALQMVLSGQSVKKASASSGVPQSTLTDRINRMNLKRPKKSDDDAHLLKQLSASIQSARSAGSGATASPGVEETKTK